jgi:penicillin-binding protein 2
MCTPARARGILFLFLFAISVVAIPNGSSMAAAKKKSSAKAPAQKSTKQTSTKSSARNRSGKKSSAGRSQSRNRSARAAASRQARSRYLARVRILQARDAGLRNIAASNIVRDVTEGEDLYVRRIAVDALAGRSGTVVVMDATNGRVLTIVNQQMALGSPVKPCSTVKLIVGLGALHEAVFDPSQDVQLGRRWSMNLTDATAHSNNQFFQELGRRLGYYRVMSHATEYGFGERTGVNYLGESTGFLPDPGEQDTGHMSSHGDGFGVTAIQLATFTAAIANGGNLYVPRVPRAGDDLTFFQPELRRKISIRPDERSHMLAGMTGAVNYGTAKLAYDPVGQVAGKTGTCTGATDKLGLFTSFSSVERPRLVVTVITTGSTEAGKRAAEIAGRVYRAISSNYLRDPVIAPAGTAEIGATPTSNR